MIPEWIGNYIGVPFKEHGCAIDGCDCYGLIRLIYREQFCLITPDFADQYESVKDNKTIGSIVERESRRWTRVDAPEFGDVVVIYVKGQPCHIGMYIEDNLMLHTERTVNSIIEEFDNQRWREKVEGFYRFNG